MDNEYLSKRLTAAENVVRALISWNQRDSWDEIPGSRTELKKRKIMNDATIFWYENYGKDEK